MRKHKQQNMKSKHRFSLYMNAAIFFYILEQEDTVSLKKGKSERL